MIPSTSEHGFDGSTPVKHARPRTSVSIAPSETATLSTGSKFASTNKAALLEGLNGSRVPNVTVPAEHKSRTLVLCFDGTGDQFDDDNSNIVELFGTLKKDDPDKQLVYYQAGIGTYTIPQIVNPLMVRLSETLDKAVAWNLKGHMLGGYEFLMQNYKAGDKICIFAFSRGAYTARCLAGMIHKMYDKVDAIGWKQANAFKATFSNHVTVDFLGVWDTVSSVGLTPRYFPESVSTTAVRVFRHAISLDERRAKFVPITWSRPNTKEARLSDTVRVQADLQNCVSNGGQDSPQNGRIRELEEEFGVKLESKTDVEEVWFAGSHCDVGGGSVANGTRPNLARIPLRWMIHQTFLTETGIMYSARGLRRIGLDLDPYTFCPVLNRPPPLKVPENTFIQNVPPPRTFTDEEREAQIEEAAAAEANLSEQDLELKDALSPIYDQLASFPLWWILEFIPLRRIYQRDDNSWITYISWNLGGGRNVPRRAGSGVKVHRSVKTRLEAKYANEEKYSPKAKLRLEDVIWVD